MDILDTLKKQEEILLELKKDLIKEKEVLIKNHGEKLQDIVEHKISLVDELNHYEASLIQQTNGRKVSELNSNEVSFECINPIIDSIEKVSKEIEDYQEINMMLTMQSIGYANKMIETIQKTIEKSSNEYSKTGIYQQKQEVNLGAIDKSV